MLFTCSVHGPAPVFMCSPDLLELQDDGTLPKVIIVDVVNDENGDAIFRFNLSPKEAAKHPVVDNSIPFDKKALAIMEGLQHLCGYCVMERRKALEEQQKQSN